MTPPQASAHPVTDEERQEEHDQLEDNSDHYDYGRK